MVLSTTAGCSEAVGPRDPCKLAQLLNCSSLGGEKDLEKARDRFYWVRQRHDIKQWCASCAKCASRKSPSKKACAPLVTEIASRPMERVAMDILDPLPETDVGNKYILVVGDYFTKWKEAYPMSNMEATMVAHLLVNEFFC